MKLFRKKVTIDDAAKAIHEYTNSQGERDNILFLRAERTKNGFIMKEGSINASVDMIPRMLVECAKNDENFSKAMITASESMKHNEPKMQAFCDELTRDAKKTTESPIDGIKKTLSEKFPGAQIMSIDVSKIENMNSEDFNKIVDQIYKASQNGGLGPESE
jgi:hypothetical protein